MHKRYKRILLHCQKRFLLIFNFKLINDTDIINQAVLKILDFVYFGVDWHAAISLFVSCHFILKHDSKLSFECPPFELVTSAGI